MWQLDHFATMKCTGPPASVFDTEFDVHEFPAVSQAPDEKLRRFLFSFNIAENSYIIGSVSDPAITGEQRFVIFFKQWGGWGVDGKAGWAVAVEGLNIKAKLTMRKAYGFKSPGCLKIALYHTLGKLPEPTVLAHI